MIHTERHFEIIHADFVNCHQNTSTCIKDRGSRQLRLNSRSETCILRWLWLKRWLPEMRSKAPSPIIHARRKRFRQSSKKQVKPVTGFRTGSFSCQLRGSCNFFFVSYLDIASVLLTRRLSWPLWPHDSGYEQPPASQTTEGTCGVRPKVWSLRDPITAHVMSQLSWQSINMIKESMRKP